MLRIYFACVFKVLNASVKIIKLPKWWLLHCFRKCCQQRWSPPRRPRGHIWKSLTSKVKSLASKPQDLENCPVLCSRTALFLESLKFCRSPEKFIWRPFFWRFLEKKFWRLSFFGEHLRLCPCSMASSIPVLGFERVCPRKGCPWPRIFCVLGLEPCVLDSTSGCQILDSKS